MNYSELMRTANESLRQLLEAGRVADHWLIGADVFKNVCDERGIPFGTPKEFTLLGIPVRLCRVYRTRFQLIAKENHVEE